MREKGEKERGGKKREGGGRLFFTYSYCNRTGRRGEKKGGIRGGRKKKKGREKGEKRKISDR